MNLTKKPSLKIPNLINPESLQLVIIMMDYDGPRKAPVIQCRTDHPFTSHKVAQVLLLNPLALCLLWLRDIEEEFHLAGNTVSIIYETL